MSDYKFKKTEAQWREQLTNEQFQVLRKQATEQPFTGKYNFHFENGNYHCSACNQTLFKSDQKFESHCGWPSFEASIKKTVYRIQDRSHGMIRTEIVCSNCGSHLGHVFKDGPTETGERYCVNSASITFYETEN